VSLSLENPKGEEVIDQFKVSSKLPGKAEVGKQGVLANASRAHNAHS